jgi:hypothetical protein
VGLDRLGIRQLGPPRVVLSGGTSASGELTRARRARRGDPELYAKLREGAQRRVDELT